MNASETRELYTAAIGQIAAESYLSEMNLEFEPSIVTRLTNGNNHFSPPSSNASNADNGVGGSRLARVQLNEFLATWDILDHIPNQSSGFSATLLRNRVTGEYTLAFRSTEYPLIEYGGDAERDSARGASGDLAFNGMALSQVSSMEKYWASLLDGSRILGATPDRPSPGSTVAIRGPELAAFAAAMKAGAKLSVSGYSLGGHLATAFAMFHGERVNSLYLFNAAGMGRIRSGLPTVGKYRDMLARYDFYMRPENREVLRSDAFAWVIEAEARAEIALGLTVRGVRMPHAGVGLVPTPLVPAFLDVDRSARATIIRLLGLMSKQALGQIPAGRDGVAITAHSAQSFLASLVASKDLEGTYGQTLGRIAGVVFPSLQESGLIPSSVRVFQVSGVPAQGRPSTGDFKNLLSSTDWNIVADSGVRAARDSELISVYIENQPTSGGIPFREKPGDGDFGTTHSITLIIDSLAVTRILQLADSTLPQAVSEEIMRAASNLRKQHVNLTMGVALAEHDTLERVVDAFGRLLFGRQTSGGINWRVNLASADGMSSYGALAFRDPFYQRISGIEAHLRSSGVAGGFRFESLASVHQTAIGATAIGADPRGIAMRYALAELNPFLVLGADAYYQAYGRAERLALYDPASGSGRITLDWIDDRAAFLALKIRLGMADLAYAVGDVPTLYESRTTGERSFIVNQALAFGFPDADSPHPAHERDNLRLKLVSFASLGKARLILFGRDGDPTLDQSQASGGADHLRGGLLGDHLYGESGNDTLDGLAGDDYIEGGPGDDRIFGGPGADTLFGGAGNDLYVWIRGDGSDRILEVRESDGLIHGRILVKNASWELVPRVFKQVEGAPQTWRSPDRNFVLTRGATWKLGFDGGEIDLGTDIRNGDFGFEIDFPRAKAAATIIDGLPVDDVVVGANRGTAYIEGGYGHDRLYAVASIDLAEFLLQANGPGVPGWGMWIAAGPGDDLVLGSIQDDVLEAGGGRDVVAGGAGNDVIRGDSDFAPAESDKARWVRQTDASDPYDVAVAPAFTSTERRTVYPEQYPAAADELYGGSGDDRIYAEGGDDLVFGDDGADWLIGAEGSDVLSGGNGNDVLIGEKNGYAPLPFEVLPGLIRTYPAYVSSYGSDLLDGGAGDDLLVGDGGDDVLSGGDGVDELHGDYTGTINRLPGEKHGSDVLNGGAGNDTLHGEGASDLLFGGDGNDRLIGDGSGVEGDYHGDDILYGEAGDDELSGDGGADVLHGGEGRDRLIGDAVDLAANFHGNDVLDGGEGNDVLIGLGGADELFGSAGDDLLYGDRSERPEEGEADLLDGGAGADRLAGQGGGDTLIGGEGDDFLFGEAGDDTLDGGPGADALDGGAGDDTYVLRPGDGADRLVDAAGIVTLAFVDGVELSALRALRERAASGAEAIRIEFGQGDSVTLDPLIAVDAIRIRVGESELMGGAELQTLGIAGAAAITGTAASEYLVAPIDAGSDVFGFTGNDLLVGSPYDDRLDGGSGDDEIRGLEGADRLFGGAGLDLLAGGPGNDRLEGGTDGDVYELRLGEGSDALVERVGEGFDTARWVDDAASSDIRFRRSGRDLVLAERGGETRVRLLEWIARDGVADRGIDQVEFVDAALDGAQMLARVEADRILRGTDQPDVIVGDEFDDIFIAGAGDDVLVGGAGDDRYEYAIGDGTDLLAEAGGFDVVAFGPGIEPGALDIVAAVEQDGALSVVMTIAGDGGSIRFGESRERRVDVFEFENGETLLYGDLLARAGGLRQQGGDTDDVLLGGAHGDSLYGFAGNDALRAGTGADVLAGGLGDDILAGGAHDDTYAFSLGDGRDVVLEYAGSDEHRNVLAYYTPGGARAYDIDGVPFAASGPEPGPSDETFNLSLGTVLGGNDTLVFGEGIVPTDIRFGLDFGVPAVAYSSLVPDASGTMVPGQRLAEQVGYVLEIGAWGDAVEVLWPFAGGWDHAGGAGMAGVPLERVVFADAGDVEAWSLAELFGQAGGWSYIVGSAAADTLRVESVLTGGWLAGGSGNDRYDATLALGVHVVERPGEGTDSIVFDPQVSPGELRLVFDQQNLMLDTGHGALWLAQFQADQAEAAMIERFEFHDGVVLSGAELLSGGIEVPGSPFADLLGGTSVADRIEAGAGDDWVLALAGDDALRGAAGADRLSGGPGSDRYFYARGDGADRIEEVGNGGSTDIDTLVFEGGIGKDDLTLQRVDNDLVFGIAGGGEVRVAGWFLPQGGRLEAVEFGDGERWDAETLAGRTSNFTDPVPAQQPGTIPAVVDPAATPTVEPVATSAATTGSGTLPAADDAVQSGSPVSDSAINGSSSSAASASDAGLQALPGTEPPVGADLQPALQTKSGDVGAAAVTTAGGDAGMASSGLGLGVAAPPLGTFDALAAAGFVSPGRPGPVASVSDDASPDVVDADPAIEAESESEPPPSPVAAGDAMERYWRWMHARLESHLASADVDDVASSGLLPRLAPGGARVGDDGLVSLAPLRAIGLGDRLGFDARRFEGLREGVASLGV